MKCFDLQVNGAFGTSFSDPAITEDAFLRCVEKILAKGVTRFLPTLPTSSMATYRRNLPMLDKLIDSHGLRYACPASTLKGRSSPNNRAPSAPTIPHGSSRRISRRWMN